MIYLITGVPGSGKTLYAVSTLVQKLIAETITGKDGKEVKRRLVVDGIPDLIIPHETMAERPEERPAYEGVQIKGAPRRSLADVVVKGVEQTEGPDPGQGLHNWWTWCKPGDVLVIDEVQRYWRPRGMGTKPPQDIAMLETHRHFGVDFVVITQNAMLLDQNVRRLVGRHLNVRRVFGGARALIYDWDGCQTDTHRTAGAVRTLWSYPKKAYDLYKSSELHTKQHQKIPLWFVFPLVVLALAIFAGPKAYSVMNGAMTGRGVVSGAKPPASSPASASGPVQAGQTTTVAAAPAVAASGTAPAPTAPASAAATEGPRLVGCAVMRGSCRCYDKDARPFPAPPDVCTTHTAKPAPLVVLAGGLPQIDPPGPPEFTPSDAEIMASMRSRLDRPEPAIEGTAARVAAMVVGE